MKLTSSLFALTFLLSTTSIAFAEDIDVEIDFIKGSDYTTEYRADAKQEVKFIDGYANSNITDQDLEIDFISGSEYAAMYEEEKKKKSWFAFLSFK